MRQLGVCVGVMDIELLVVLSFLSPLRTLILNLSIPLSLLLSILLFLPPFLPPPTSPPSPLFLPPSLPLLSSSHSLLNDIWSRGPSDEAGTCSDEEFPQL